MGKIQWVEYNPEEYESSSEQELPYLFDLIPAGSGKYDVRVFNKKESGTYDAGDFYGSAYDEEQVVDVLACDSLAQAKEAAEYYLKHGGFFEFRLPRTSPPTPDQFESTAQAVDSLTETGEMSASELEPGGDWYETAVTLRAAAKELAELTGGLYSLEVKPFDQYQGPYAPIHLGGHTARLWVVGDPGMGGIEEFVLSGIGEAIEGDIYTIAEVVKERIEGLPTTEAPTPEQFESVVDGLLKGTPQGLQRMGKQALRDPRRCRKPNGH